jgi:CHAT domain-containing protein
MWRFLILVVGGLGVCQVLPAQSNPPQRDMKTFLAEWETIKGTPGFQENFLLSSNADINTKAGRQTRITAARKARAMLNPLSTPIVNAFLEVGEAEAWMRETEPSETNAIESAIPLLTDAGMQLETFEPAVDYILTQELLGEAYLRRLRDDRAANIERALRILAHAELKVKPEVDTCQWIAILGDEAEAYSSRLYGWSTYNLTFGASGPLVINAMVGSGQIKLPDSCRWQAVVASGRATIALYKSGQSASFAERSEMLDAAIEMFQYALTGLTVEVDEYSWGKVQRELGLSLFERRLLKGNADEQDNGAALNALRMSQTVFQIGTAPFQWATSEELTGDVYRASHSDAIAEKHYRAALSVLTPTLDSAGFRRLHGKLGDLDFAREEWDSALVEYRVAIEQYVSSPIASYLGVTRAADAELMGPIFTNAAYCSAISGDVAAAFSLAGLSGEKDMAQTLATEMVDSSFLPSELTRRITTALRHLHGLNMEFRMSKFDIPEASLQDARTTQLLLQSALAEAKSKGVDFLAPTLEIHLSKVKDGVVVMPIVTSMGSVLLVVPAGTLSLNAHNVVRVDGFDLQKLQSVTGTSAGVISQSYNAPPEGLVSETDFMKKLAKVSQELGTLSIPLALRLKELGVADGATLHIVANGALRLLPFQAAPANSTSILGDLYAVSYAANMLALEASTFRDRRNAALTRSFALVYNPDIPDAWIEINAVFRDLNGRGKISKVDAASIPNITDQASTATDLIFVTHGKYESYEPTASKILATPSGITVADIVENIQLADNRLVVLSACETAMHDVGRYPDQGEGFADAFLEAGAAHVLATLWPVDSFATVVLMSRFYDIEGKSHVKVADALRTAQTWMRKATRKEIADYLRQDSRNRTAEMHTQIEAFQNTGDNSDKPYQDAYYWGGFVDVGN